jgi:cytidylate kinase
MPNVVHLRVVAPIEQRIERIQQIAALSADAARDLVHRRDRAAGDYVKSFYNVDWTDPLLYTVVINTNKLTPPLAVDLIVKALECLPEPARPELPSVTA